MELRDGYKQTEVGVIPEGWEIKSLDDVCIIIMGQSPIGNSYNQNGDGVPLINGPTEFTKKFPIKIQWTSLPTKFCKEGDILICVRGSSTGRINISDDDYCIGRGVAAIRGRVATNQVYLEYQVFNAVNQILSLTAGSTFPNIDGKTLKQIQITLPPTKSEQTAIATALSDVDALIQSLTRLIAKKRNIKQGAMQELLTPKEGWVVKKLGDVADVIRGASPRPIDSPVWFDERSKIGWVRISDVTKSTKYLKETTQKLSELGIKSSRFIKKHNLIMSICATVGRPILIELDVCIHDGFVVFANPIIEKEYLYYFLTYIENAWSKYGQTGSQMNLNTGLINATQITIPKQKSEQNRIATILSDMDAEVIALETKLEKYQHIKQGMMQELLTGKTRLI